MYWSWTENVVLLRNLLGIILDLGFETILHSIFVQQIQSFISLLFIFKECFKYRFKKLFNNDNEKIYGKLISCLGTAWGNKN